MGASCSCKETQPELLEPVDARPTVSAEPRAPEPASPASQATEPKTLLEAPSPPAKRPSSEVAAEAPAPPAPPPPAYTLAVVSARGLRNADWLPGTGKSDCYCVVKVAGAHEELLRTGIVDDALDPIWDKEFEITSLPMGAALELSVWGKGAVSSDLLGKVTVESSSFEGGGFNSELALEGAGEGIAAFLKVKVKAAGRDYPPGPPAEISIEVDRVPGKPLGLDLDVQDACSAYVVSIKEGPFQAYNEGADPARRLSAGDFIVSVNGVAGKGAVLLEQMKRDASLRLLVRKPLEFSAALAGGEPGRKLGLEVGSNLAGRALLISRVADGLVKEWNERSPAWAVRVGDRIVAVGGRRGSAQDLKKWLVAGEERHVTVARPSSPASAQG